MTHLKYPLLAMFVALNAYADTPASTEAPMIRVRGQAQFDDISVQPTTDGWTVRYRLLDDLGARLPAQAIEIRYPNEPGISLTTDTTGTAYHRRPNNMDLPSTVEVAYAGSEHVQGTRTTQRIPWPRFENRLVIEAPSALEAMKPFTVRASLDGKHAVQDSHVTWTFTSKFERRRITNAGHQVELVLRGMPAGRSRLSVTASVAGLPQIFEGTVPLHPQRKSSLELTGVGWQSDGRAFVIGVQVEGPPKHRKRLAFFQDQHRLVTVDTPMNTTRVPLPRSLIKTPGQISATLFVDHPDWMSDRVSFDIDSIPPMVTSTPLAPTIQLLLGAILLIGTGWQLNRFHRRPSPSPLPDTDPRPKTSPTVEIERSTGLDATHIQLTILDRRTGGERPATVRLFSAFDPQPKHAYEPWPLDPRTLRMRAYPADIPRVTKSILVHADGYAPLLASIPDAATSVVMRLITPREAAEDILSQVLAQSATPKLSFGYDTPAEATQHLIKQGVPAQCASEFVTHAEKLCFRKRPPTIPELAIFETVSKEAIRALKGQPTP